ncbi:MAG: hypothetical protein EHM33_05275 [Chloroflexi bacterium]|nr:MAG: hypothetical protein EHM33_05275 [Chloroflexota bacterium]
MKSAKIALVVLILLNLLIPPQSAHADMAPPPAPGLGGLRPLQYQHTEVQMVYERVEMNLNSIPTGDDYIIEDKVDVTAWFVLHNTGSREEAMKAAFPLNSLTFCDEDHNAPRSFGTSSSSIIPESFKVIADGVELQTEITEVEGIDCVSWATFDIKFPVNKDVLVRVDYSMQTQGIGHDLILEYILETGAGWKGPIKQAYIVFRFPYLVTSGNVDSTQTTSGYQSLYNEIFWSYQNLEPTPNDNIIVAFFEPRAWMNIKAMEDQVAKTPTDIDTWLKLFDEYAIGAPYNAVDVSASFEKAIKFNPNNADLYAKYAEFLVPNCCYPLEKGSANFPVGGREYAKQRIIPLINHSLELDSSNKIALDVLESVRYAFPDTDYTPPPTIPPTATSLFTPMPSVTPTATVTFSPESPDQSVVTVVQTELVSVPTSTPDPMPTATNTPIQVTTQNENPKRTSTSSLIFGALIVLIAGIGIGTFWSKRMGK